MNAQATHITMQFSPENVDFLDVTNTQITTEGRSFLSFYFGTLTR